MNTITMSHPTDTAVAPEAPVTPDVERDLPDLDPAVGDALGDEVLLSAARATRVTKVKGGGRAAVGSAVRSHTARAWSARGNVD